MNKHFLAGFWFAAAGVQARCRVGFAK